MRVYFVMFCLLLGIVSLPKSTVAHSAMKIELDKNYRQSQELIKAGKYKQAIIHAKRRWSWAKKNLVRITRM